MGTNILLIQYFNQSDYGSLRLVGSLGLFVGYLTSFGLEGVMHRYLSDLININALKSAWKIFKVGLLIRLSGLVFLITVMYLFYSAISSWFQFPQNLKSIYLYLLLYLSLGPIEGYFATISQIYLEIHKLKILLIVKNSIKLILVILLIKLGLQFKYLIFTMIVVSLFSVFITISLAYIKLRTWKFNQKSISDIKKDEMISYASYTYFGMTTGVFKQMAMDNFFIASFLGIESVAIYSYGCQLVNYTRMLNPFSILRGPNNTFLLKTYTERNNNDKVLTDYFRFSNKIYFFILIPISMLIGLLFTPITQYIFNPIYVNAKIIFFILLISFFVGDMQYCFNAIAYVKKRADINFYSNIFSIYNIIMNIILLKYFGINGIAIATGSTVILIYFYYIIVFKKKVGMNLKIPFFSFLKAIINTLPTVVFLLLYRDQIENAVGIILAILISGLLYLGMSFINKIFTEKERNWINSIIGKRLWVF